MRLRSGDLQGAHEALTKFEQCRSPDPRLRRRIEQIEQLLARQKEVQTQMFQEPLRYAHAYIKAGRLKEGLRFLQAAVAKYPLNERIQKVASKVEAQVRLLENKPPVARSSQPPVSSSPEGLLKELLQRVRKRRRAPSRWLMDS